MASLLFPSLALEVEKESRGGKEEIGDSQVPLRIILLIYQLSLLVYSFISITTFMETTLLY